MCVAHLAVSVCLSPFHLLCTAAGKHPRGGLTATKAAATLHCSRFSDPSKACRVAEQCHQARPGHPGASWMASSSLGQDTPVFLVTAFP